MQIKKDEIELNGGEEFSKFVNFYDLAGAIQLKEPIIDPNGNVLIREKVNLNESMVRKISSLEGKHVSILKVNITKGLIEKLRERLGKELMAPLESKDDVFLTYLFENNLGKNNSYRDIVINSLYSRHLVLFALRIFNEKRDFFRYISRQGLLALCSVIQKMYQVRLVHRYAFLAGMFSDICVMDSTIWKLGLDSGDEFTQTIKQSVNYLPKLGMSNIVIQALSGLNLKGLQVDDNFRSSMTSGDLQISSPYFEYMDAGDIEPLGEEPEGEEAEIGKELIAEAVKIAKFITIVQKKIAQSGAPTEDISEKIVMSFAYNTEKGMFKKDPAEQVLLVFKQYEVQIRKIRRVAQLENECLNPPSAWAYPKPEPTQILCKNKVFQCKHCVSGWDISIFSEQNAYGYIGTRLTPGSYPKCRLEEKLDKTPVKKTVAGPVPPSAPKKEEEVST
ncbi:MAG TPA: hypothetical protein PL048_18990 [Leptospiraceae bacterium]|nr:hypothetical protein [Leptospiraceae bacterium]HMZ60870.1 hypothetical protein [Leptospiraceae bacterium]HNF14354.1 hypothetical protein [Leptospiraceae bacterium]HNF26802.1 hypothetical protein [Leptospiraceae bacterium]HNM02303.1 hypothetical protein [Leptospiraceae bacterium]